MMFGRGTKGTPSGVNGDLLGEIILKIKELSIMVILKRGMRKGVKQKRG